MQEIYLIQSYKSAQEVESLFGTIILYIYMKSNIKQYRTMDIVDHEVESLWDHYIIYTLKSDIKQWTQSIMRLVISPVPLIL